MSTRDLDSLGLALVREDLAGMDYPSLSGYNDFGDEYEDFGGDDDDETGRRPRRKHAAAARRPQQVVQKTILVGQSAVALASGSQAVVTIRPQFDFVAEDVTFQGSRHQGPGTSIFQITQIQFGDRIIFSNATGAPEAMFATASFVRGLVKGAAIAAGLDIQITGTVFGGGAASTHVLIATLTGLKRGTSGCGPGAV